MTTLEAAERGSHAIDLVNVIGIASHASELPTPPYGILYVGSALKAAGYRVRLHHIFPAEAERTAEAVAALHPLFLGVSTFTGLSVKLNAEFSRAFRRRAPTIPIVWGGIHASLSPEESLGDGLADVVVEGEGELTAVALADALASGAPLPGVAGVAFREAGKVVRNPPRPLIADLDTCALDWSLLDPGRYVLELPGGRRLFDLVSSRGCPCDCGFCYNAAFHRRRFRAHSVGRVLREVRMLRERHGVTEISSSDDNFFANPARAVRIIEGMRALGVTLTRADIHLHEVTRDTVLKLRELGVRQLFTGWETGNDRLLKLINKRFTVDGILEKTRLLARFPEIQLKASAMICLPTETRGETLATLATMLEMLRLHPHVRFNMGVYVPFPGTPLYPVARREGFVPPDTPEGWSDFNQFSRTLPITWIPWLTPADRSMIRGVLRYHPYLERRGRDPGESRLKYAIQSLFRRIVRLRFERLFFRFPFEFAIFRLLRAFNRLTFRI